MYRLPPIEEFQAQTPEQQKQTFDNLFEPCSSLSWFIQTYVLNRPRTFTTYGDFIELVRSELLDFLEMQEFAKSRTNREVSPLVAEIIAAHPRLGVPKTTSLSEHSSAEQKNLGGGSDEMRQRLVELNAQYEARFPGLRYVVFVNGRGRDEIMEDMRRRIERGSIELEREVAFNAICDIALDRARKLSAKI
ncbi:uncharacterized protein LODBEIA_P22080 [Lodderomyces beijingensis]|uniref:Oxo-4-hydroxy-4-carboxy-5-ureidoimidazoline decarboxylase domain-containing protein n=1 Tax=Lodderomyces beijingensis TaxID=1775926 RepID=A0ABP0ZJD9_9ASCO